jgi:archaellum biogenesis ATPase FlaH
VNLEYSVDLQKLFLEILLQDAQTFVRVMNIYNPENFDRSLRDAAAFIAEHSERYKTMPGREQIAATTGVTLRDVTDLNEGHYAWFLEEFERFTKKQEIERAILKAADLIEQGEFAPVEKLVKDAIQISLTRDLGTDYWGDPKARIDRYFSGGGQVVTGWPQLDRLLYGGFSRGELNIFAGGSGSGKSLVMMNLALNWLEQGLHGVYVTLELSEELCGLRTDAMLTGMSTKDIRRDVDTATMKVRLTSKKSGTYQIKSLPAQSNINDIRAFLKEYQIQTSRRVDFIMIDYLDLLMPVSAKVSPNDLFVKDKYVSEELRNLARELGILMVTASQLNRCLALDTRIIANGKEIEIKDVQVGDLIDSNQGKVTVLEKLPVTKQSVYRIKTKSGKEIICSSKHKFPTTTGVKTIDHGLAAGDRLYIKGVEPDA